MWFVLGRDDQTRSRYVTIVVDASKMRARQPIRPGYNFLMRGWQQFVYVVDPFLA